MYIYLEFSVVKLVTVFEEELVCGLEAGLDAVFHDLACPRRWCKLLHLEDARQWWRHLNFDLDIRTV